MKNILSCLNPRKSETDDYVSDTDPHSVRHEGEPTDSRDGFSVWGSWSSNAAEVKKSQHDLAVVEYLARIDQAGWQRYNTLLHNKYEAEGTNKRLDSLNKWLKTATVIVISMFILDIILDHMGVF